MPLLSDLNKKSNIKLNSAADLNSNLSQPVIARYNATSTAGQTTISLPFLVDQSNTDAFFLFINGQKLTIGASNDYIFSAIDGTNSSSLITLNQSLTADLNIEAFKMGLKKEVEYQTDSRFTQLYDMVGSGFQGFVDESAKLTAVNGTPAAGQFRSSVTGRASIPDLANDLKVRMGIDRIPVQQIVQLQNEFGPNGEPVWAALNDDRGLIRFVGDWKNQNSAAGPYLQANGVSSAFVEITFYGTGINIITAAINSTYSAVLSVDGGSEGSNIIPNTSPSGVIGSRNYAINSPVTAVSGLTLGIHTVKIRNTDTTNGLVVFGFEVLNESANVNVRPGTAYQNGKKLVSSAASSVAYNSGTFDSVLRAGTSTSFSTTRGARVLTYIKSDGTIGKSAYLTNSAPAYLSSADHANEGIARTYHWREFGAGRSDDFSLFTSTSVSSRAFTLEDGTTTLVGANIRTGSTVAEAIDTINSSGNGFITITFVGTGLDVVLQTDSSTRSFTACYVDGGSSIGSISKTGSTGREARKIVSGLPYGTHTVRFENSSAASGSPSISQFIVYQPKKPSIPAGAVELADYNVIANYVANTTAGLETIGTGVLRKFNQRELIYSGTWGGDASPAPSNRIGGFQFNSSTAGAFVEYTFFGTGFDLRNFVDTDKSTGIVVSLNGTTMTTANFPTMTGSVYGGGSWTPSTGTLSKNGTATTGSGFQVSGLPLAKYTVRFSNPAGGASNLLEVQALDIIVPIHSHISASPADLQNTLPIGSESIADSRRLSPVKSESPQKAWAQAVGIGAGNVTTTSTSFVPMPNMSVTLKTSGGRVRAMYTGVTWNSVTANTVVTAIYIDGIQVSSASYPQAYTANYNLINVNIWTGVLSPGVHKFDVYWYGNGGTTTAAQPGQQFIVEEV